MFPLDRHTIFLTLAGSQAHGTARDGSDVDLRGVCIAPLPERLSLFGAFEQHEGGLDSKLASAVLPRLHAHPTACHGLAAGVECVIFDIAKFARLCAAANPNALEILFADEADWVLETPAWRRLHSERRHFLTQKVQQTFLGYAMAQLKKIKSHRAWLLNPAPCKPAREDFGLPVSGGSLSPDDQTRIEQSIAQKMRGYGVDDLEMPKSTRIALNERVENLYRDMLATSDGELEERMRDAATRALSLPANVVAALDAEKRYRAAMKQWESYQTWKAQRNAARADLERKHGYDTKHAMHLIRLMRMGLEVLDCGELLVRREDAADLRAIRDGALSFDALLEAAAQLQDDMQRAAARSRLPDDVDHHHVDRLAVELMLHGRSA